MNALESALRAGATTDPQRFAGPVDPERLARNRTVVDALLAAPRPSRTARLLRRLGMPDATVRLVTATPGLRWSWLLAVAVAIVFALGSDGNAAERGGEAAVFLTLAPLVPLVGVALAFGRGIDPTHDVVVAAPMDGFRVFLTRCLSVLVASVAFLLLLSLLGSAEGWLRIGWLLPALAVTAAGMAAAGTFDPRVASAGVAFVWVAAVMVVSRGDGAAVEAFGPSGQVTCAVIALVAAALVVGRRSQYGDLS